MLVTRPFGLLVVLVRWFGRSCRCRCGCCSRCCLDPSWTLCCPSSALCWQFRPIIVDAILAYRGLCFLGRGCLGVDAGDDVDDDLGGNAGGDADVDDDDDDDIDTDVDIDDVEVDV